MEYGSSRPDQEENKRRAKLKSEWNINPDTRNQQVSRRRVSLRGYCGKVAANSKTCDYYSFEYFNIKV
jgi:hypothetical protein